MGTLTTPNLSFCYRQVNTRSLVLALGIFFSRLAPFPQMVFSGEPLQCTANRDCARPMPAEQMTAIHEEFVSSY